LDILSQILYVLFCGQSLQWSGDRIMQEGASHSEHYQQQVDGQDEDHLWLQLGSPPQRSAGTPKSYHHTGFLQQGRASSPKAMESRGTADTTQDLGSLRGPSSSRFHHQR
jgi:hypothetical protein